MDYTGQLHWADVLIIVAYFIVVIIVGLWSSLKNRNRGVSGYFLAGRSMTWFLVGGSLYGSNIGTEHFIGLSGSGAAGGIAVAGFELQGMFTLVLLGWLFLPVYISSGVFTMPEYLKKRYGGRRIQFYLAALTLFLSIVVKTSVDLFSGSIFIKQALGWNLYAAISLQLTVAAVSTLGGGLTAVMWTDTLQVMLLIVGSVVVMVLGFNQVGGYSGLIDKFFLAIPSENATVANESRCAGIPSAYAMHLFRPFSADLPWTALTFGLIGNAIWYWCCDQVIVQKALAGKNYTHSKGGCLMTGFLKFLPLWMMVFPGMISRILYTDEVACTNPKECGRICGNNQGCTNIAYPLLVIRILPAGVRGILVAVMMAAIMSNVTSTFNSCSTVFTMDIWHVMRKKASQLELLIVGRLFVVLMIITAILWIPIIDSFPSSQLITYVQSIQSYMGPPICAIFVLGIFVPRVNEQGAFWGLIVGLIIGLLRLILEISYGSFYCYEFDTRPFVLSKVHYLHFGFLLLVFICVFSLVVSYLTPAIDPVKLERLTFWTRHSQGNISGSKAESRATIDVLPSANNPNSKIGVLLHFICGTTEGQSMDDHRNDSQRHLTLKENLTWKRFCDVLAILLLTFGIFVYTFWA